MQPDRATGLWFSLLPARRSQRGNQRPWLVLIALCSALILNTPSVHALQANETDLLQQQRNLYRQAQEALQLKRLSKADSLIDQLRGYPLYPYLRYQRARSQLKQLSAEQLQAFIDDYPEIPLAKQLQFAWINQQAKSRRWQTLLDHFPAGVEHPKWQCLRLRALINTGHEIQALSQVAPLWTQGHSQPKSCDPLFKHWLASDQFDEEYAWNRFWLALEQGNSGLARYVSKRISKPKRQKTAQQALSLHRNPGQLARINISPSIEGYRPLLLNTLKRLGRKDPALAFKQLRRFDHQLKLSIEEQQALQRRFGLSLLSSYRDPSPQVRQLLEQFNGDPQLAELRLRNLLEQQDWQQITALLEQLPSNIRFQHRWRYWRARALAASNDPQQRERAVNIYTELAKERSYYGFLAADKLGSSYRLNNQTLAVDPSYIEQLARQPAMVRARELFFHDQRTEARREWLQATRNLNQDQHHQAATLARQWGWYSQSVRSTIAARQWNDLLLRFPLVYTEQISQSAQRNNIDMNWILAIVRQESAFTPDARSPAGASGLMQLMPRTAKQVARQAKVRYRGSHQLVDPKTNLKLGSYYLARLSRRYNGNRILASAAYNAGFNRVNRWLSARGELPADIWIETIPFKETRNYVQNVLSYALIYSDVLGQPKQFLKPVEQQHPILLSKG